MATFILTGGSDGLGAAFGKLAVDVGHTVVCISRSKPAYDCIHIPADLGRFESIANAAKAVQAGHSRFDALINCAGVIALEPVAAITPENLAHVMQVNVMAPVYLTSQLFDSIKANEADILNVGSTVGTKAYVDQCAYGASKWALRGVSENLRTELKGTKSRVIQFSPGGFKSRLVQKFTQEEADLSAYMEAADLAALMLSILTLPKSVEVSEILVNRK